MSNKNKQKILEVTHMCMKNISTDILFFDDVSISKANIDSLNLHGVTKEIPEVEVKEYNEDKLIIPQISLMLSINATEKKPSSETNAIDFSKTYKICIRVTETASGDCVDIVQFDIKPGESQLSLCRNIYSKRAMYRVENIIVTKPPQDKDLCVFKVLIQEVVDGTISEDKWIAQSMHPVRMV